MDLGALRRVDLNLLVLFVALVEEGSVSRAARRVHLGQPGLSGALARLRELLDDPVLVRQGRGMTPTPRALALLPQVQAALAALGRTLAPPGAFEPARCTETFVLGLGDAHEVAFAGPLLARLRAAAPGARLILRPTAGPNLRAVVEEQRADAALSVVRAPLEGLLVEPLFTQGFTCLWHPVQLALPEPLDLEGYLAHPHGLVTFTGDLVGVVDHALEERGLAREVVCGVAHFGALPELLERNPLLVTVPEAVAALLVRRAGLRSSPLPLPLPRHTVSLVHHPRDAQDPARGWFRALLAQTVREVLGLGVSIEEALVTSL